MLQLMLCLLGYLPMAVWIDICAAPRGRILRRPPWAWGMGAITLMLVFAAWFSISWRPVFAMTASLLTFGIVTLISNVKYRQVREPLTFVDFVLVPQIWRHPDLYFVEFLRRPVSGLAMAGILVATGLWWGLLEPSMLPDEVELPVTAGSVAIVGVVVAWLLAGPLPAAAPRALARRLHALDTVSNVMAYGLAATLLGTLLAWRGRRQAVRSRAARWPSVGLRAHDAPVVVAVQSESFVDLQSLGLADVDLPALRAARQGAGSHGRLAVQVQGAGTMRSEFAFLTGRPIQEFGFGALHPYFRVDRQTRTLAHVLRDAGFRTTFLHPYDLCFFDRNRALPHLGFDQLIGEAAFPATARDGYYIGDEAVADRIAQLVAQHRAPTFVMAVTMENHHPWRPGRLAGIDAPVEQYLHHLRNADRMLGMLMQRLEQLGRPAVLTFYGDHVPILDEIAVRLPDTRTDYIVRGFGERLARRGIRRDRGIYELAEVTLEMLGETVDLRSVAPAIARGAGRTKTAAAASRPVPAVAGGLHFGPDAIQPVERS